MPQKNPKSQALDKYRRYARILPSIRPTPTEAVAIQKQLKELVIKEDSFKRLNTIAGADIAVNRDTKELICGIKVFEYPSLIEIESRWVVAEENFPYIPGLLSFREGPALLRAFKKLRNKPDVLICDGHGFAHPRGFGIASHIGLLLDLPTFGVAKKKLFGVYDAPSQFKGAWSDLLHPKTKELIGAVVRTRDNVKPVFVSIGHKISLSTAIEITYKCAMKYRVPEPTRLADRFVKEVKAMQKTRASIM